MKRAVAVIGSGFGDEGKGLMVDYFCRQAQESPLVVRFNGGAQAGHTAVTPEGKRHVFHHFGAGTLAGADTYLSKNFLINPVAWRQEASELTDGTLLGNPPHIYAHWAAPVTTIYDMFVNQMLEESRTDSRHGSCGMGVHETMLRQNDPLTGLILRDLFVESMLDHALDRIRSHAVVRLAQHGLCSQENLDWINNDSVKAQFVLDCREMLKHVSMIGDSILKHYDDVVFEGAQGLLLDACNKEFFPHVTHSRTGLTNVIPIIEENFFNRPLNVVYVARSYLTRHGAGPLPGEDPELSYEDNTNIHNEWQHGLRFARQNSALLLRAIDKDLSNVETSFVDLNPSLAITHMDQKELTMNLYDVPTAYVSHGPTWKDVNKL